MRAVLGIDAAWTDTRPSGVALATETTDGWRLVVVAASYQQFHDLAEGHQAEVRPSGSRPDPEALLNSASKLLGGSHVNLVAIDMPLAKSAIVGRRTSDNAVSRAYGGRGASTHNPNIERPGRISDKLRKGFEVRGYSLLTSGEVSKGLIEVYPHPALIEFAQSDYRLECKFGKIAKYWPSDIAASRKLKIWKVWRDITLLMDNEIADVERKLPSLDWDTASGVEWKAYEDKLDAVVCAAVGICVLEGRAAPFGDEDSAIWVPTPGCAKPTRTSGTIGIRSGVLKGN